MVETALCVSQQRSSWKASLYFVILYNQKRCFYVCLFVLQFLILCSQKWQIIVTDWSVHRGFWQLKQWNNTLLFINWCIINYSVIYWFAFNPTQHKQRRISGVLGLVQLTLLNTGEEHSMAVVVVRNRVMSLTGAVYLEVQM